MLTRASARREAREIVSRLRWRLLATGRDLTDRFGILGHLERLRVLRSDHRRASRARAVVATLLGSLGEVAGDSGAPGSWRAHEMLRTSSDLTILTAGPPNGPFRALIKIAETRSAADMLDWQRRTLLTLREDERLGDWRSLLPHVLAAGEADGTAYLVEERIAGTDLQFALARPGDHSPALRGAGEAISRLHRATASDATIGPEILDRWVRRPIAALAAGVGRSSATRTSQAALARLAEDLCTTLEGLVVTISWVHGDYSPGNILTGPDGRVSGIIDWEFAHPQDLPALDVVTLLLTARMCVRRQELGQIVCDILDGPRWSDAEASLVGAAYGMGVEGAITTETVVLLCWLRHVARMISRHRRYVDRALWIHGNVDSVLESLARPASNGH